MYNIYSPTIYNQKNLGVAKIMWLPRPVKKITVSKKKLSLLYSLPRFGRYFKNNSFFNVLQKIIIFFNQSKSVCHALILAIKVKKTQAYRKNHNTLKVELMNPEISITKMQAFFTWAEYENGTL